MKRNTQINRYYFMTLLYAGRFCEKSVFAIGVWRFCCYCWCSTIFRVASEMSQPEKYHKLMHTHTQQPMLWQKLSNLFNLLLFHVCDHTIAFLSFRLLCILSFCHSVILFIFSHHHIFTHLMYNVRLWRFSLGVLLACYAWFPHTKHCFGYFFEAKHL